MDVALVLSSVDRERIVQHLRAALPNEGVGLLAVTWRDGDGVRLAEVRKFYPGTNFRASPVRFEMDRYELIAAMRDIDDHDWLLGAIAHSHPRGPATPSRTDLAEAFYPEALMLIVSFASGPPDLQAWRLEQHDGEFIPREVPIRAPDADGLSPQ
jgi:proteasome lid subunit RPN8/RPN11